MITRRAVYGAAASTSCCARPRRWPRGAQDAGPLTSRAPDDHRQPRSRRQRADRHRRRVGPARRAGALGMVRCPPVARNWTSAACACSTSNRYKIQNADAGRRIASTSTPGADCHATRDAPAALSATRRAADGSRPGRRQAHADARRPPRCRPPRRRRRPRRHPRPSKFTPRPTPVPTSGEVLQETARTGASSGRSRSCACAAC